MGILRIRDINKGMAIKQGDETPLNFELYDANGDPLNLASTGKVYFKRNSDIYHEQDVSISNKIATFTLSTILPPGNYYLEFHVSNQIFPSEDREVFKITSSALGEDITVIQINGIERVAQRALDLIEDDLDAIHQAETERETAELDRQAQEEARQNAETQRVENELVRSEGMVELENLSNPQIWYGNGGIELITVDSEEAVATVISPGTSRLQQSLEYNINEKYYIYGEIKPKYTAPTYVQIGSVNGKTNENLPPNTWSKISDIITPTTPNLPFRFYHLTTSYNTGESFEYRKIKIINLTQAFGAGNEPTKEQMDVLMQHIGYFDGETLIPQSAILAMISQKANRKQEEWITPTLQNGATIPSGHNFQFRKDEFGNLQLLGRVTLSASAGTLAFRLPSGYRPFKYLVHIFSDDVQGGKDFAKALFHPDGWVQCYGANKTIVFANIIPLGGD